jgi:hypothetical protein
MNTSMIWRTQSGKEVKLTAEGCVLELFDMIPPFFVKIDGPSNINNTDAMFEAVRYISAHMPVKQIIFNGVTTVCIFHDGTKVISRPQNGEKFDRETGVAMCIAKYIYGSRSKFLRAVESGHEQKRGEL